MSKETVASYNLDFKFKFNDVEFRLNDFARYYSYHNKNELNNMSRFDTELHRTRFPDFKRENYYSLTAQYMLDMIKDDPIYTELHKAFDAWAKKRQGVKKCFEETFDGTKKMRWGDVIPKYDFNLFELARHDYQREFKTCLEKNRPTKIAVGDIVILSAKAPKSSYDPFYWSTEHEKSPRIGVICKNTENTSGRSGKGSLLMNVLWFASGENSQVPIRHLLKYVGESTT